MELDKCDLDVIEHAHPRVEWGIRPEIKWCLHWMRTMPPSSSIFDPTSTFTGLLTREVREARR